MLDLRSIVAGVDEIVPTLGGGSRTHVDLDNATATPVLWPVIDAVGRLLPLHAAAHRGTGYKARVSTKAYEQALASIGRFVGADPERDVVVLTGDPIGALHRLSHLRHAGDDTVVLTAVLDHRGDHRARPPAGQVTRVAVRPDGTADPDDLDRCLRERAGRATLLAVPGASDATGVVQPVHQLVERVHAAGGRIAVDTAHLASHRRIDMRPHGDPGRLDVVALSGHTMYAPFGSGALVGD
ncbi:MAG TPA: aminotransferase class V-fold PLP-dependent enzyme, partial [Acidimicrobiales bacterium]